MCNNFITCLQSKSLLNDSMLNIFSPPSILKDTINSDIPAHGDGRTKNGQSGSTGKQNNNLVTVNSQTPVGRTSGSQRKVKNCSHSSLPVTGTHMVYTSRDQCFNCAGDPYFLGLRSNILPHHFSCKFSTTFILIPAFLHVPLHIWIF